MVKLIWKEKPKDMLRNSKYSKILNMNKRIVEVLILIN